MSGTDEHGGILSIDEDCFQRILNGLRAAHADRRLPAHNDPVLCNAIAESGLRGRQVELEQRLSHDPIDAAIRAERLLGSLWSSGLHMRDGMASQHLEGVVEAVVFAEAAVQRITVCCASLAANDRDLAERVRQVAFRRPWPPTDAGKEHAWWDSMKAASVQLAGFVHRLERDQPTSPRPPNATEQAFIDQLFRTGIISLEALKAVPTAERPTGERLCRKAIDLACDGHLKATLSHMVRLGWIDNARYHEAGSGYFLTPKGVELTTRRRRSGPGQD